MNKIFKAFIIVAMISVVAATGSFIIRQVSLQTVEVSIYCKSTSSMGVFLYADNCSEGYPFGSGGPCIALPLNEGNEIQKISYFIPKGTENKIRFDFDTHIDSDITIVKIEVNYPNKKRVMNADKIAELFIEVDESNINADGVIEMTGINDITSLCCLDYSTIKKSFSPDWIFTWKCVKAILVFVGILYAIFMLYLKQDIIHYNLFLQIILMFISAVAMRTYHYYLKEKAWVLLEIVVYH